MIELQAGGYVALINPTRGGSCVHLSRFGASVLRTPESDIDYEMGPFFYGTPLLFFPNRISDGKFEFEGRTYTLPINEPDTGCFLHGTLHETQFEVVQQQNDSVELRYQATDEKPYLSFSHAFTLTLKWELDEAGLHQQVSFTNDSNLNMPIALAFHTTFQLPFCAESDANAITMQLDTSIEYSRNMKNYLPDGGWAADYPMKQELSEGVFHPGPCRMSRFFKMGDRKELVLTDPIAGVKMHYTALQGYDYWMVYNGLTADFLSVEPQSWLSNCPNAPFAREETGFSYLQPGESRTYETCMRIEKLMNCVEAE